MEKSRTEKVREHFNKYATLRDNWRCNSYYHTQLEQLFKFLIPKNSLVLEIGCSTGNLLHSVNPKRGVGIDISENTIKIAKTKFPKLKFYVQDAENLTIQKKFDYIILSDLIGNLQDVQKAFAEIHKVIEDKSRIIITFYSHLWEPILILLEKLKLKMPVLTQNWLSTQDVSNLLNLAKLEPIKKGAILLFPFNIPIISSLANKYLAKLPIFRELCLVHYFIARKQPNVYSNKEYSISIIIPARNEAGNIEKAIIEIPAIGKSTETIFVEGGSKDNTLEEIKKVIKKYKRKKIMLINQGKGNGKGGAVRKGFLKAQGDILMILDADLTVTPKSLLKFYQIIKTRQAEFVMGSRLVYPMEKEAMRFMNILGNKFFSIAFSWLLDQPIKDTLCGTKVLFKDHYIEIAKNRSYFGDFDPFGDFDLIFGASKMNLKIQEIPVQYKARTYGKTNISRFKHGWLLSKMTLFAARKIKFV